MVAAAYNVNRRYEQQTGRYTAAYPLGISYSGPSLFAYVNNRPTIWDDPLGLQVDPVSATLVVLGSCAASALAEGHRI